MTDVFCLQLSHKLCCFARLCPIQAFRRRGTSSFWIVFCRPLRSLLSPALIRIPVRPPRVGISPSLHVASFTFICSVLPRTRPWCFNIPTPSCLICKFLLSLSSEPEGWPRIFTASLVQMLYFEVSPCSCLILPAVKLFRTAPADIDA